MAFQILPFLLQLALGFVIQVVGFMLIGAGKNTQPDEVRDMDYPTAEAGRPIPVVFGEMDIKGVNILWFGDKQTIKRKA